jgi:hypothetical protein
MTSSGMSDGAFSSFNAEPGGHAGMAGSVGGSGGQMSVSSGGGGDAWAAGGHVRLAASAATAFGASVTAASGASATAGAGGSEAVSITTWSKADSVADRSAASAAGGGGCEPPAAWAGSLSPAADGTVRAHSGVDFCIGTAVSGCDGSAGGEVSE